MAKHWLDQLRDGPEEGETRKKLPVNNGSKFKWCAVRHQHVVQAKIGMHQNSRDCVQPFGEPSVQFVLDEAANRRE